MKKYKEEKEPRKGLASLKDFADTLPKYTAESYRQIGEIICRTTTLERIMDSFISEHYCKGNKNKSEMAFLLLSTDKISYENKRKTLQVILDKHHPGFSKSYPTFVKDLQEIGELRNILAHG